MSFDCLLECIINLFWISNQGRKLLFKMEASLYMNKILLLTQDSSVRCSMTILNFMVKYSV